MSKKYSFIEQELRNFIYKKGIDYSLLLSDDLSNIYKENMKNEIYKEFFKDFDNSLDSTSKQKLTKKNKKLILDILIELEDSFNNSCEKYLPNDNQLFPAIIKIMEILLNNINNKVNSKLIYTQMEEFSEYVDCKDLTKRALANIKCHCISDFYFIDRFKTDYQIDINKWFNEYNRYFLNNKELLIEISPLIISYLKSDRKLTVSNFFQKIDSIIYEISKPIEKTSSNYKLEYEILESIQNNLELKIIVEKSKNNLTNKTIFPIRICIDNTNQKYLEYYQSIKGKPDIKKIETILIKQIYDINNTNLSAKDFYLSKLPKDRQKEILSLNKSFMINDIIKSEIIPKLALEPTENEEQIILECNSVLFEYFLYKPLKNQSTFKTEDELKYFEEVYSITPKDNKFYVVATDTITNASSSILKCLGEVKVLTPTSLNDLILEKIQKHNSLSI